MAFIDISENSAEGFSDAEALRRTDCRCLIVFTADDLSLIRRAMKLHPFGFLEFPIMEREITELMADALRLIPGVHSYLRFKCSREDVQLPFSEFAASVCEDHYIVIVDSSGRSYKTRMSFAKLTGQLEGDSRFISVNKGIIVNMDHITDFGENSCTVLGNITFPIKVRGSGQIRLMWQQYCFGKNGDGAEAKGALK